MTAALDGVPEGDEDARELALEVFYRSWLEQERVVQRAWMREWWSGTWGLLKAGLSFGR